MPLVKESYAKKIRTTPRIKKWCSRFEHLNRSLVIDVLKLVVEHTLEIEFHKGTLELLQRKGATSESEKIQRWSIPIS